MEQSNIPPSRAEEAITFYEQTLSGEDVMKRIEAGLRMKELEAEYGKTYSKILGEYDEIRAAINSLNTTRGDIESKISQLKSGFGDLTHLAALKAKIDKTI